VEQDYSFAILQPLQKAALERGHEVRWLLLPDASPSLLEHGNLALDGIAAAVHYRPEAVFAPGDRVPAFIPGLKVQVFHGLNEAKRGNLYPERGLFDLYCTEGPERTGTLQMLAEQCGYFRVKETGWLKLDALLNPPPEPPQYERPQILYASTFSPALSGAEHLYEEIRQLAQLDQWQWLVTLHPKMAADTAARYREMAGPNLAYFGTDCVIDLLRRADIMVSDNSSILQEFLILQKPVVTFRNRAPLPCMIDIAAPRELESAINAALQPDAELSAAIRDYGPSVTPFLDGRSASRVLDAAEEMLESGWEDNKPANLWRNWQMRRQLNYYKL
jgi:CDP-glycerol glycerophosphotransferase (TagB/SpsB family)